MKCYRCGRKLSDNSKICKGCGAVQTRTKHVRSAGLVQILKGEVGKGNSPIKVWSLCLILVGCIAVLTSCIYLLPLAYDAISDAIGDIELNKPEVSQTDTKTLIDSVKGTILSNDSKFASIYEESEAAYDDGSWEKCYIVDEVVKLRLMRVKHADEWVNTHIFELYPDVVEVESFDESDCPTVSGYRSSRIQIPSTAVAEGCVVEVLYINAGEYDHMFIIELPVEMFEEYEVFIEEWVGRNHLVDAQTGEEQFKLSAPTSPSDVSGSDTAAA